MTKMEIRLSALKKVISQTHDQLQREREREREREVQSMCLIILRMFSTRSAMGIQSLPSPSP